MEDRFRCRWWDYHDKEYTYDVQNLCEMDCFGSAYGTDCWGNPDVETADNFGELLVLQSKGYGLIEQCTGLKDKNGKLIYEGDILKIKYRAASDLLQINLFKENSVEYDNDKAEYSISTTIGKRKENISLSSLIGEESDISVIGNIHENPELLEED